jgi:hypothetical protein
LRTRLKRWRIRAQMSLLRTSMVVAAAAALLVGGCGGGGGGGGSGGGEGESGSDLAARAAEAQQFLTDQIQALATVQDKAQLLQRLNDAQDAAHRLSNDIEDTEVPPELINIRAELALAMRTITLDIGRVRGQVQAGDVPGAHETLANLRSILTLQEAIAAVQSAG